MEPCSIIVTPQEGYVIMKIADIIRERYCVKLIDSHGNGSYLSVKGRTSWLTRGTADKHCADIQACIDKGLNVFDTVAVYVEIE